MTHDKLSVTPVNGLMLLRIQLVPSKVKQTLLDYLLGWCITDTPPVSNDIYNLYNTTTKHRKRSVWIQHVVCTTDVELETLLHRIMNED